MDGTTPEHTVEGHIVPIKEQNHRIEEGDKTTGCPPDIGEQMPPLTYSSSDTDSRSSYEGLEIFYQPVMMDGEGYNTHMVVIGSEEAILMDDDSVSITGDMRNNGERDGHIHDDEDEWG